MTVINTSPAIHLHAVLPGGLGSLPRLIGEVIVPWEVCQEVAAGHDKDATWVQIQALSGINLRTSPIVIPPLLQAQIDIGEAAVLQTATNERHGAVILDDLKARRIAAMLGLAVTGTLGILIQAKRAGHLPSVKAAIAILENRGMWLDPKLAAKALNLAGETA